jgi:NADPH:quinone reductase-like Zn-dependent oxidoreductase
MAILLNLSALAAWQALFDHAGLAEGHRILIHGGAGGVGSFAVQFARWSGAHVLATAATQHREFVLDLGAHEVIDYTTQRFEDVVHEVDVVLDLIGVDTLMRSWSVLQPGGILITLAGAIDLGEASRRRVRGVSFIVKPCRTDLTAIARLIDAGTIGSIVYVQLSPTYSLWHERRKRFIKDLTVTMVERSCCV